MNVKTGYRNYVAKNGKLAHDLCSACWGTKLDLERLEPVKNWNYHGTVLLDRRERKNVYEGIKL